MKYYKGKVWKMKAICDNLKGCPFRNAIAITIIHVYG